MVELFVGKAKWTMSGVLGVVKENTMKIFISDRCYVPFHFGGNMEIRLVKFMK